MKTLKDINEELQFNLELMNLLDVIKNISIFRFRALQMKKRRFPRFIQELNDFFTMFDLSNAKHPFINPAIDRAAVVVITSDEGFMGGLNLQVIESALAAPEAYRAELVVIGERGARHLSDMGRKGFTIFKSAASFEERYKLAIEVKDHILSGAKKRRFGKTVVFYPKPVTFVFQKIEGMRLLPLTLPGPHSTHAVKPNSYHAGMRLKGGDGEVIIESPIEGIVEFLAEEQVVYKLVDVLEDSKLSEFAARALHLEESTRTLKQKEKGLHFQYFRAYHEVIDRNIRDLFSARMVGERKTSY